MKFATRNVQRLPLHLDYVAALLGKSQVQICYRLQNIQLKNRTVYDKNETLHVIWLNEYCYCHTSCPCVHHLPVHMIQDDLTGCLLYCQ